MTSRPERGADAGSIVAVDPGASRSGSFAGRAVRVLEARSLLISDAAATTVLDASEPSEVGRSVTDRTILDNVAELEGATGVVVASSAPTVSGRWISVARGAVAIHVRCVPGWELDDRRRQMLHVLARTADELCSGPQALDPTADEERERSVAERVLTELALSVRTYTEVVAGITAVVAPLVDAGKAGIAIWHDERRFLELLPWSFGGSDQVVASSRVTASEARSLAAQVVRTGRGAFSNRPQTELPLWRGHFAAMGVTQLMTLPVTAPERIVGVLHVANKRTEFSDADVTRLEAIMPSVAALVERVRDRHVMWEREQLSAVVARIATAIASGQPLARLPGFFEEYCTAVRAQRLAVSFHDGSGAVHVHAGEVPDPVADAFVSASARGSIALRTSMAPPRVAGDAGWSALHTPVLVAGLLKGTLSILRVPYEPFVEHERDSVRRLADVIALAWATESYHRERAEMVRLRERQRIADELHDHVSQILYSGQLTLESAIEQAGATSTTSPPLGRARDMLVRGQNSVREVIAQLSTSRTESLPTRLGDVVQGVEDEFEVLVNLVVEPPRLALAETIPDSAADDLMSAAREGIINAAKHAGPCQIWVTLKVTSESRVTLTVDDSGVGLLDQDASGYGLTALRRKFRGHGGVLVLGESEHGGVRLTASFAVA